jgi:hypothetical protein
MGENHTEQHFSTLYDTFVFQNDMEMLFHASCDGKSATGADMMGCIKMIEWEKNWILNFKPVIPQCQKS